MVGVLNKWTGAKIKAGTDKIYGRWSWVTLQGKNKRTVTFISAYRVNPGHQQLGEFSVYKQQYNLMLKHESTHQDPRTQTIIDLESFITERIHQGEEIILAIDANETINTEDIPAPHSIHHLMESLGLIDIATTLETQLESHKGGRRIDFCLVSPNILTAVIAFGYLPYDHITTTDHRPYFVDLHIPALFSHPPDAPTIPSSRPLKSNLPRRKKRYLDEVTQNFHTQRLFQAVQILQKEAHDTNSWTPAMQKKYENID